MQDYFLILGTKCNKLGQEAGRIVRKAVPKGTRSHAEGRPNGNPLAAHMPITCKNVRKYQEAITKDLSSHSGTDTQLRKFKTFAETGRVLTPNPD